MPIQFPSNPTNGQTYIYNDATWSWTGSRWQLDTSTIVRGETLSAVTSNIQPTVSGTVDLGTFNSKFRNVYLSGNISANSITNSTLIADAADNVYQVGFRQVPQNNQGAASTYTLTLNDDGKHVLLTGGTTATVTIPTQASVPFDNGSAVTIINNNSGAATISGSVTIQLANGASGNRTVAAKGICTLIKVATDLWYATGAGVT